MKHIYLLQVITRALLMCLFLQNCDGFTNTPVGNIGEQDKQLGMQAILDLDKEFVAEGGHLVTFYNQEKELKAGVQVNPLDELDKFYSGIDVLVEKGVQLADLPKLDKKTQQRRIQVQFSTEGKPKRIAIHKPWLMGGGCCKNTDIQAERAKVMKKLETTEKEMTKEEKEVKENIEKLKTFMTKEEEEEEKTKNIIKEAIKDINLPQGYKALPKILSDLKQYETNNLDNIKKLDEEFGKPFINKPEYAEYILPEDKVYFNKCVQDREDLRKHLEQAKADIIKKAEEQAKADLKEKQKIWDEGAEEAKIQLDDMLDSITASQVTDNIQPAIDKIKANINECEGFKQGVKSLPSILKEVDKQIQIEKQRLYKINLKARIIKNVQQSKPEDITEKAAALQKMIQSTDSDEIKWLAILAIQSGNCDVLELAIIDKGFSVQEECDYFENTPLHKAVAANQIGIVKTLLQYGAKSVRNQKTKQTPLDLASKPGINPEIKKLLEEAISK